MAQLHSLPQPQLGLDEKVVDIPELVSALEERLAAKSTLGDARKVYAEANEAANVEIAKLELPDGVAVRAGDFRITRSTVAARSVAFDTKPTTRVTITWLGSDE